MNKVRGSYHLPNGWIERTINAFCKIYVGRDLREECFDGEQSETYKYPVYSNSVENKGLYGFYNFPEFTGASLTVVGRGAGLGTAFTRIGSFGAIGRLLVLFPNERIHAHYLTEYINSKIRFYVESSGIPQLTGEQIGKYKIPVPSLSEQTAIANLLSTWNQTIEKTERLIVAKGNRFFWLTKSLIRDKCDTWEHLRADKIFASISDKCNADAELLSVTQDRGVIPRTMLEGRVMSPEGSTDSYKLIKEGDFAISLRSFQGGIEYSRYQGLISPAYTVLRPTLKIHNDFYRHFFKSYLFIEKYLNIAVIGIRDGKQISIPDFMTVKIPYPSVEMQKSIAETLNTARQEIDLLKKQVEAYRKQKHGLMQKLLTGKWHVTIDEKEG